MGQVEIRGRMDLIEVHRKSVVTQKMPSEVFRGHFSDGTGAGAVLIWCASATDQVTAA